MQKCVYRSKLFISYGLTLLYVPFFSSILNTFSFPATKNGIGIDLIFSSKLLFHWEMPSYQDKNTFNLKYLVSTAFSQSQGILVFILKW